MALPTTVARILLATAIALACSSAAIAIPNAPSEQPGWIVEQWSGLAGMVRIYISKDACKLVSDESHFTILMKAPLWHVVFYSDNSKAIYETDVDHWKGQVCFAVSLMTGDRYNKLKLKRTAQETMCGFPCKLMVLERHEAPEPFTHADAVEFGNVKEVQYWVGDKLAANPKFVQALCKMVQIPDLHELPLRFFFMNDNNHSKTELKTKTITKATFDAHTFQAPAGYKKVTSEKQVLLMDPLRQSILEDLGAE